MGLCYSASLKRQKGSAVIFALGLSVLVVALATALLLWLNLDMRRVEQLKAGIDRLVALQMAEAYAAERIQTEKQDWSEPWIIPHDEFKIIAQVEELSGRLNFNSIFAREQHEEIPASFKPKAVISRMLELFQVRDAQGLIEKFQDKGELVFGLSQFESLSFVREYLYTADPEIQQVNINATTPEVLASILDIDLGLAQTILFERPFETQEKISEVLTAHELRYNSDDPIKKWLGVKGHYYLLRTQFTGKRRVTIYSVFHRKDDKIKLLWRSWGTRP